MKQNKLLIFLQIFALFSSLISFPGVAQVTTQRNSIYVHSESQAEMVSTVPVAGMVTNTVPTTTDFEIRIINSCFGTNLRSAGNPLSPSSTITAIFKLTFGSDNYDISIDYPAQVVTPDGMKQVQPISKVSAGKISGPSGTSASIFGNTIRILVPIISNLKPEITSSFIQTVNDCSTTNFGAYGQASSSSTINCGSYMGQNGPLASQIQNMSISSDNKSIELKVSFPGENGFCGGFYSPLMLFFDEKRPQFIGQSQFPLVEGRSVAWPEANSSGYFLVHDQSDRLEINKASQLFGESKEFKNGFDKLAQLDTNKDGFITVKDPEFKHLYLWKNTKGDGISQKHDLIPLGKIVEKISLKYESGHLRPIGKFAEEREKSFFWFKDDKGLLKKGQIVDIWLSPK